MTTEPTTTPARPARSRRRNPELEAMVSAAKAHQAGQDLVLNGGVQPELDGMPAAPADPQTNSGSGTDLTVMAFLQRTWTMPRVPERDRARVHAEVDPDDAEWFREWCKAKRISHRDVIGQLLRDLRAANR